MLFYIVILCISLYILRRLLSPKKRISVGPPPMVTVTGGKIEGSWACSIEGRQFANFSGIPFAKPPVGELRFLRPQPAGTWEGVRKCIKGQTFIQKNIFRSGSPIEGTEDYLGLNVYSHNCSKAKTPLPVMVWIHGGGYVSGSGSKQLYGAEFFMDREVVLVSLTFRLSVLGGLFIPGGKAPGNQMMRDQVLGLQWVQENIASFGGDPSRVTIFGESAGGMSVMNHVLSPMSGGLFSAAIIQSGSPYSPFVGMDKHPAYYARKLAEKIGTKPGASHDEMLNLLQSTPAEELQAEQYMFEEFIRAPMPFKPIVDGGLVEDPFLPEEPIEVLKKGTWNKVPLIIGTNMNEGLLVKGFYDRALSNGGKSYSYADREWETVGPLAFFHREKDEKTTEESALCWKYRKNNFPEGAWSGQGEVGAAIVKMYGDILFAAPTDLLVKALTENPESPPVYHYLYNHQGPISLYDVFRLKPWQLVVKIAGMMLGLDLFPSRDGVCHADELFLMFKAHSIPANLVRSAEDKRVSKSLLDMWTNFAIHHNPTPNDGAWTRFDPKCPKYLEIGSKENRMDYSENHKKRMEEWTEIWREIPPTMKFESSWTWSQEH